ncbi:choline ABC transporter substrate-binding protein [Aureimonas mangrovi]|uniref:choline ABC transporter substrate-binding protein n=1 Tax=Aureimonas mangrovi TaxID=2758041 RepID=UPI00163DB500|nr:choline ABC transporter substrate-binding protein [Aureimonas mangrovi]
MAHRIRLVGLVAALSASTVTAFAAEPASCQAPRFSDVGWTDITATTAAASLVLEELGYQPDTSVLSVAVTFQALQQGDIDIFLGNWMPLQEPIQTPLVESGAIDVVATNLEGALIGFAVPAATYEAGLRTYADIANFRDELGGQIYGIEAGSSANETISGMIENDTFGLGDFTLVESSEQAMLSQVESSIRRDEPIVFFGWRPHPMNVRLDMRYLEEGNDAFGPDDGAATVLTNTRAGYAEECPNVGRLLENMAFTVEDEDLLMSYILDEDMEPSAAAERWLKDNPETVDAWLEGVTTFEGEPGAAAVRTGLDL